MWRFIQNAPRAVRQHWQGYIRPAPQSTYREDEAQKHEETGSRTCSLFTLSPQRPSCRVQENQEFAKGEDYKRNQEEQEQKTQQHGSWMFHQQQHSPLEAVGWGTALLLGMQLSHWPRTDGSDKTNKYPSLANILYNVAFAMPKNHGTALQITGGTTATTNKSTAESSTNDTPAEEPQENQEIKDQQNFDRAGDDWMELCETYTERVKTELGWRHARRGQYSQAVGLWREASVSGFPTAHYNLGLSYELGRGVEKNLKQAVEHYQVAADSGHSEAAFNLAILNLNGEGGLKRDPSKAINLLEKAASKGMTQALTQLGIVYTEEDREDMDKAASYFKNAADKKEMNGQFYLGLCYENGWGVAQNPRRAGNLYSKAAESGHTSAQISLAQFLEKGHGGCPKDKQSALQWYQKAAEGGDQTAWEHYVRLDTELKHAQGKKRLQYDGGTTGSSQSSTSTSSSSTPVYSSSPATHSPNTLSDYMAQTLSHFNPSDLESFFEPPEQVERTTPTQERHVDFYIGDEENCDTLLLGNQLETNNDVHNNCDDGDFGVVPCL